MIRGGGSLGDAAKVGGGTLQIVRDWVQHFNAHGPDVLETGKASGPDNILDDCRRHALAETIEAALFLLFMVWFAGGSWTSSNDYGKSCSATNWMMIRVAS